MPMANNSNGATRRGNPNPDVSAMQTGLRQAKVVRRYLEIISNEESHHERRSPEFLAAKLAETEEKIRTTDDVMVRLEAIQYRANLEERIAAAVAPPARDEAEADFIEVAAEYGQRKGISYPTWRAFGVPASVLQKAGITRTLRTVVNGEA